MKTEQREIARLFREEEPINITVKNSSHGEEDFREALLVEYEDEKIVIKLAENGYIVSFSQQTEILDENFGYLKVRKNPKVNEIEPDAFKVTKFIEKPKSKEEKPRQL